MIFGLQKADFNINLCHHSLLKPFIMKNQAIYLIAFLAIVLFFGSCVERIEGVGEAITQEISMATFDQFTVDGNMDVVLKQGATQKVMVIAQPEVFPILNTQTNNGHWNIQFTQSVSTTEKTIIEITLPTISQINISSNGNVKAEDALALYELNIQIEGNGNVELLGTVEKQFIEINGIGNVHNFDLISNETTIISDGMGDAEMHATNSLDVTIKDMGDVSYQGAPTIDVTKDGMGDLIDAN